MIDLRDSTVLVNNIKEYSAITKIAMKQGFTWASGDSLNKVFCRFPTRLEFRENYYTYYGSIRGRRARDYPKCMVLIEGVRRLIMIRKEMANDKFKKCTVLVNNKAEYIALIKEAKKQGYTWADGTALTNIFCDFPTRLRFNEECKVYYNSSAYFYNRDYQCKEIVGALRNMILKRKEGQLC